MKQTTTRPKPTLVNAVDQFPQDILAGIGTIVAKWGYLQFQLGVIVRYLSDLPKDTGRVLMVGAELGVLCNMIRTFTSSDRWISDTKLRDDLKRFARDVQDAASVRNDYAHGVFGLGSTPGTYIRYLIHSAEHRREPGEEILTADGLALIANRAQQLWIRAEDLSQRIKAWRQASRQKR